MTFPKNIKFKFPWRAYQREVLEELDVHLDDNHLNIVAAPGSGKTVLGLEVMLRIDQPTLILAPSIAIRNQWLHRFRDLFLQLKRAPAWISMDIKKPKKLTIVTYQALHTALKESDEVITALKKQKLTTIIIDEAHHLRNAWWQSLIALKDSLEKPKIVALTATPPYDVEPKQWKNYQSLCGPIDAEISVPELVYAGNLCPHQDYVYLNSLSIEEAIQVNVFRLNIRRFLKDIPNHQQLVQAILSHPYLQKPNQNLKPILQNSQYTSSMIIFLKAAKAEIPHKTISILAAEKSNIPKFTKHWGEVLFTNMLYQDLYFAKQYPELQKEIREQLTKIGAIERRKVHLKNNKETKTLLKTSINKLNSISNIVRVEWDNLQADLRMVILTDYIRKNAGTTRIGVVPIFEKIRQEFKKTNKIAILSGSIVILPNSSKKAAKEIVIQSHIDPKDVIFKKYKNDATFSELQLKGKSNKQIVHLVTELFQQGEIEILVGTKSLLGEGWDAPAINSLILASFVGSFMLSNQMRGRAIRIHKGQPNKTANIWHLASVEKDRSQPGYDFYTLKRRFKSFVGIDYKQDFIENGLDRLYIPEHSYSELKITKSNNFQISQASNRNQLKERWDYLLQKGTIKKVISELQTPKELLPRKFIFQNTIQTLVTRSTLLLTYALFLASDLNRENFGIVFVMFTIGVAYAIPGLFKALKLFLKNGPIAGNLRQIGEALLRSLCYCEFIKTDVNKLKVTTKSHKTGAIKCNLEGGTSYETSLFLDCLEEILNPINNPRYLITRKGKFHFFTRQDFHSVPEILGAKKKTAIYFSKMWDKYLGANQLIYTRSLEGRKHLIKARQKAMTTQFLKKSKRFNSWK